MIRLQMRLRGAAEELFRAMQEQLNVSQKELVLDAFALMHFATQEIAGGKKIGSYDPQAKEFSAITTPSLEAFSARAALGQASGHSARAAAMRAAARSSG